ncbi:MAG: Mur ligase family protein [Candidatus Omnitrophica bacterium]|nr:Mur ligase family protein [Candidatus Omnitrophota bacterium]MDD5552929.1 Mur ligase family protein [Candidatus Omnitrophota bacterium]
MRNADYFRSKNVAVAGLARSGFACAKLIEGLGARVSVTDNQSSDLTRGYADQLKQKNIKVEIGAHTEGFIKGKDMLILSPGIPDTALPVIWARKFNVPVISEIELAWMLCPSYVIAVTGSNGKTTVTTLIGRVLEASGRKAFVCGNIGNPFCGEVEKMAAEDFVSLEISSFQLEKIRGFKPRIALILNFTRNHLDRYRDMEEYLEAKKRVFMNQDGGDYLVLNGEDPVCRGLAQGALPKTAYFSSAPGSNPNYAAVLAVASILGIDKELCLRVFSGFKGIEHRLEDVQMINDVQFINDSKSTTVDSTLWAFKNISRPILLIAGGKDKGSDYGAVSDLIRQKARAVILIGEAKGKIKSALRGTADIKEASTLEEAVGLAYLSAKRGDCVLLSPMCSSYDMFRDYEERGRVFKKSVIDLAKKAISHGA